MVKNQPPVLVELNQLSMVKTPEMLMLADVVSLLAPSKYMDAPMLLVEYAAVGSNGEKGCTEVSPARVMAKLLIELSMKRLLWQVSSCVLVIAVSGVVGTAKFDVYTAVPLTARKLEMNPVYLDELPESEPM